MRDLTLCASVSFLWCLSMSMLLASAETQNVAASLDHEGGIVLDVEAEEAENQQEHGELREAPRSQAARSLIRNERGTHRMGISARGIEPDGQQGDQNEGQVRPTQRIIRKEKKRFKEVALIQEKMSPEGFLNGSEGKPGGSPTKMAEGNGGHAEIGPASLSHLSRVRQLYYVAQEASLGMLVGVALFAFIVGGACTIVLSSFLSRKSRTDEERGDQPQREESVSFMQTLTEALPLQGTLSGSLQAADRSVGHRASGLFEGIENFMSKTLTGIAEQVDGVDEASDSEGQEPMEMLLHKFDFESIDELEQKTRRWQWCTPDQIDQLGLLTQAATKPFEGYKRIDVRPSSKDVEDVLLRSNVDFTVFDFKKECEALLWKLLRVQSYFMIIDAHMASRRLLVMTETVRLRWNYNGRVLIQKADDTFLGARMGLPGNEKPGSEAPIATARKLWENVFKLSPDIVNFVEDSEEDTEMIGYPGLRCIERTYIIDVRLKRPNEVGLDKVGLPHHADFSKDIQNDDEHGEAVRDFKWMTKEECMAAGVMLSTYESECTMIGQADCTEGATKELTNFLFQSGVDINAHHWQQTKHGFSKLESLAKEVASGKCYITKTNNGIHRCVTVVATRLWSPDRKLMLIEKGRKSAYGEEEWRARLPGSKKDITETLVETGMRVCDKQLNFTEDDVSFGDDSTWEYFEYSEVSSCYTGVLTKYQKFFLDVILEDDEDLERRVGLTGRVESLADPRDSRHHSIESMPRKPSQDSRKDVRFNVQGSDDGHDSRGNSRESDRNVPARDKLPAYSIGVTQPARGSLNRPPTA